jgi:hypothetical protein
MTRCIASPHFSLLACASAVWASNPPNSATHTQMATRCAQELLPWQPELPESRKHEGSFLVRMSVKRVVREASRHTIFVVRLHLLDRRSRSGFKHLLNQELARNEISLKLHGAREQVQMSENRETKKATSRQIFQLLNAKSSRVPTHLQIPACRDPKITLYRSGSYKFRAQKSQQFCVSSPRVI